MESQGILLLVTIVYRKLQLFENHRSKNEIRECIFVQLLHKVMKRPVKRKEIFFLDCVGSLL